MGQSPSTHPEDVEPCANVLTLLAEEVSPHPAGHDSAASDISTCLPRHPQAMKRVCLCVCADTTN